MLEGLRRWLSGAPAAPPVPAVELDRAAVPYLVVPPVPEPVAAYVDGGMAGIDGWGIDPASARLLVMLDAWQKARGDRGALFELGVHEGRVAILLALLARPGEPVVLVDLFERQDENVSFSGRGDRARLEENLARWAPGAAPEIVQANTMELDIAAVPGLSGGVRLAHIDAGHDYASVRNDLAKTEAALAPGGIVVVDDFLHSGFPEVNEACHAHFADGGTRLAPVAIGMNKLILADAAVAVDLVDDLSPRMELPYGKPVRFHGQPCLCLDHH